MRKIVLLLFLTTLSSCGNQSKKLRNKNKNKMEYFNIDIYKDWESDTNWSSRENKKFLEKGSERTIIWFYKNKIQVTKSSVLNPYTKIFVYNEKTNMLLTYVLQFYQFPIGTGKHYDENGILIKEIDHDAPYSFSVKEVIEKVKQQYNIDLEDKTQDGALKRDKHKEYLNPVYEVYLPSKESSNKTDYILIDGKTGEVLYETSFSKREENQIPPFNQYLISLEKKKKEDNAPYKTYKGKTYTKKEWEIFEEKWYQDYEKQKNGKGFWNKLFE